MAAVTPLRVGIVKEQDPANCRVRVVFPDRDQMLSWWLPVVVFKTQNDKGYFIPDLGEQVVCLMDEHDEDGAVLGAIYSSVDTPPVDSADKFHLQFKDGAAVEYDRASHAMTIALPAGATFNLSANGATIQIDGSANVNISSAGKIEFAGGGPAVARVGDSVVCPAGTGQITTGSSKVTSG